MVFITPYFFQHPTPAALLTCRLDQCAPLSGGTWGARSCTHSQDMGVICRTAPGPNTAQAVTAATEGYFGNFTCASNWGGEACGRAQREGPGCGWSWLDCWHCPHQQLIGAYVLSCALLPASLRRRGCLSIALFIRAGEVQGDVRLQGGSDTAGRVELCNQGQWGR